MIKENTCATKNEDGFILVLSLVALVTLSLLGVWAMNTASVEMLISGNHQRFEEQFQIAEGGVSAQGGDLGFNRKEWYEISDPNAKGIPLIPEDAGDFDPGGDKLEADGITVIDDPQDDFTAATELNQKTNPDLWPTENLIPETLDDPAAPGTPLKLADNEYDYTYLTTYLYDTEPPKGTGEEFAAYKFRVNSNKTLDLELGGLKIGPKVVSFED